MSAETWAWIVENWLVVWLLMVAVAIISNHPQPASTAYTESLLREIRDLLKSIRSQP